MKRPHYGNATPGDLACALMRPKMKCLHERDEAGFAEEEDRPGNQSPGQREASNPSRPSRDCFRTLGR